MHRPIATEHAQHDLTLVAGHAAGDLSDTDRAIADTLLAGCSACAELRRDLVAIEAAARAMPPATTARDFRLTPEQAERLRRGSRLRGLLRPFAAPGSAARPLAAAFTTIGIAGIFVAAFLPGMAGQAGTPATSQQRDLAQVEAAASQVPAAPGPQNGQGGGEFGGYVAGIPSSAPYDALKTSTPPVRTTSGGGIKSGDSASQAPAPQRSAGPVAVAGGTDDGRLDSSAEQTRRAAPMPATSAILAGSLGLLAVGLLLFGLRFAGRRIR